jgi:hypothetical protein
LIIVGVANSDLAIISFLGSTKRELAQKLVPKPIIISVPKPEKLCRRENAITYLCGCDSADIFICQGLEDSGFACIVKTKDQDPCLLKVPRA